MYFVIKYNLNLYISKKCSNFASEKACTKYKLVWSR